MIDIKEIEAQPQRQDSVAEQLADLVAVANRLGMYDAADTIRQLVERIPVLRYGCHCDLDPGMKPDGCVIDTGELDYCIHAQKGIRKEQCDYWRIITPEQLSV